MNEDVKTACRRASTWVNSNVFWAGTVENYEDNNYWCSWHNALSAEDPSRMAGRRLKTPPGKGRGQNTAKASSNFPKFKEDMAIIIRHNPSVATELRELLLRVSVLAGVVHNHKAADDKLLLLTTQGKER